MKSIWTGAAVAKIDAYFSLFVAMLAAAFLVAPAPPAATAQDKSVCTMAIDISWPATMDVDVDLWAKAPGDRAVGYSAKDGKFLNLVRDDLGSIMDIGGSNNERICARGLPSGEYAVNLHLFSLRANAKPPVPVSVTISYVDAGAALMQQFMKIDVELNSLGQELTVVRFEIGTDGKFVTGSDYDIPIALRSAVRYGDSQ